MALDQEKKSFGIFLAKEVVEKAEDPMTQISLAEAKMIDSDYELGDIVNVDINSRGFGRIAVQNAKNVILQQIREAERKSLFGLTITTRRIRSLQVLCRDSSDAMSRSISAGLTAS